MVKKLLTLAMGLLLAIGASAQTAPKTVTINQNDVAFWVGTGSNSTLICIGWDDDNASYTPTVVVWGIHWNGTITLLDALDTLEAYDTRFSYTISGGYLSGINYNDTANGIHLTPSASSNCNNYGGAYGSTNLSYTWLRISESTCDNYNFTGVNNLIYASDPNASTDPVDATIAFSDILYWVGTGSDSAVFIVSYAQPDTALAWGFLFNSGTTIQQMVDAISAADPRLSVDGDPSYGGDLNYVTDEGDTLELSPVDSTLGYNFWWTNLNGVSVASMTTLLSNGDVFKYGDYNSAIGWDFQYGYYMQEAWTTPVTPVTPPATETPVEATIDASDILYWVGTGSNEAVLAVNWVDTALAWGYRWNGTKTVADMMADIAAADPRFSYSGTGWLNDIYFNDGTVSLSGDPNSYWGSTNNSVMDAGMTQTLADGDFEKWSDAAAGVIVDSMEWSGIWYYTYVFPMTIYPVSAPDVVPEEAIIDEEDILYWVGSGSNKAVMAVNWADTALAWGYRWTGTKTVADMMADIATADPRFSVVNGALGIDDILFNDGTVSLAITPGNYWGSTNNGVEDMGMGQTLADGDLEKWGDPAAGVVVDSTYWGDDWGWGYTYVYPMTIHPVSVPDIVLEDATIAAEDIHYWIGEGENEAIFVVNWATKAYAWGYRFSTESVSLAAMMDDIAAADERFAYSMNGGYLSDITYTDGAEQLAITPGNWWEHSINGASSSGMAAYIHDGDFSRWADPAAGVAVDSFYYEGYGWFYSYVYPMAITPVEAPAITGPFCGIAGSEGCNAVAADSSAIVAWATACTVELGPQNISVEGSPLVSYHTAQDAVGPCNMTDNLSVVSLGDGGSATLTFAQPIADGPGPDFAVFENSFGDYFLELAFVEVSSDGERFVRFPATSLTQTTTQIVSSVDPTFINNLAGKFRMGYGTPFDLNELRDSAGLDINAITHVRVVDVVGSIDPQYATYDAFGHIVNDPWPTDSYSGGFDLDGVGVINVAGENSIDDVTAVAVSIWPNPATDRLHLTSSCAATAELYDFSGRLVATYTLAEGSNSISIGSLPAGVYMLRAAGTVQKVVKL